MDPFLQKKYGMVGRDYIADIHRTYKTPIKSNTFEKALAFRENEKARVDALVAENKELSKRCESYRKHSGVVLRALKAYKDAYGLDVFFQVYTS